MFQRFFGKSETVSVPETLFSKIREQSRNSTLFSEYGVPDTVMGRFDMLALHTYLFANRLKDEKEARATNLNQDVFDLFVDDIERALRELGIGDTTVPKRKKRMVRSFYGQIEDFDQGLNEKDIETLALRAKQRYGEDTDGFDARKVAQYMVKVKENLSAQSYDEILQGELAWIEI